MLEKIDKAVQELPMYSNLKTLNIIAPAGSSLSHDYHQWLPYAQKQGKLRVYFNENDFGKKRSPCRVVALVFDKILLCVHLGKGLTVETRPRVERIKEEDIDPIRRVPASSTQSQIPSAA